MNTISHNRTAIILGASGAVGTCLAQILSQPVNNVYYEKVFLPVRKPLTYTIPNGVPVITDFQHLTDLDVIPSEGADVFCCLGTTLKTAGTKEEARKVDVDLVIHLAFYFHKRGAKHLVVVSSVGADAQSNNFYLKNKGDMEVGVKNIGFLRTVVVRPSLLISDRAEFRAGEKVASYLSYLFNPLLFGAFKKYRSIHVKTVAQAMARLAVVDAPAFEVVESDRLAEIGK